MDTWAIIKTGGKQYKVSEGDRVAVEKLHNQDKESITFSEILAVCTEGNLKVGQPYVDKAKVRGKILENIKDKKIRVVKYKSKSRYLRTTGHRQQKTKILIEKIES